MKRLSFCNLSGVIQRTRNIPAKDERKGQTGKGKRQTPRRHRKAGVLAGGLRNRASYFECMREPEQRGLAPLRSEDLQPIGTPSGADAVGVEKPPGNEMAGRPVLFDSTPLRSTCGSPIPCRTMPPLMRIQDGVEPLRRDGRHQWPGAARRGVPVDAGIPVN